LHHGTLEQTGEYEQLGRRVEYESLKLRTWNITILPSTLEIGV